ncbi:MULTISPECIES: GNAT family N-acetyltransferase [unclassified Marinimicrobium]|uniref:GNAT family N-acetyltransferase n=1 Tax=unclassified Marinimicrobium TaxID=2632100 RepID=UPI00257B1301|nr:MULTISPECIES: GNAT family N-acetyltransferase [unclassified Marinimicrobium]
MSTPRSEYNDVSHLVQIAGGVGALAAELNKLSWDQLYLPDIEKLSDSEREIATLSESQQWGRYTSKSENSYSIDNLDFEKYLTYLSTSTRLSFFNRRSRLHEQGRIERFRYALKDINTFFSLLNHFHIQRWGRPCYSYNSMKFLENFSERLDSQGGETIFEVINVNGEPVSTLFDVIWDKRRYNFQTGYAQDYLRKISLGSIHLGYAIEESLRENLRYDLLAGSGKKTDYKASISTNTTPLNSIIATRGYWKLIRSAQDYIKSSNSLAFLSKKKGRKT